MKNFLLALAVGFHAFAAEAARPNPHALGMLPHSRIAPKSARKTYRASRAVDCSDFIRSLPPNSIHGTIEVPEDWRFPRAKKIAVFYWGLNFSEENKDVTPLVYFNGGPGAAAHGMIGYLASKPDSFKIPFLFIDQRGTGCSDPLPNPAFTNQGVQKTGLYGARSIVYDAEAIRRKLRGGKPWRIFGQSFGSLIAHRYIELAPEGLSAVYAHGMSIMRDGIEWTEHRARSYKRVGDLYFNRYPKDRDLLNRARLLFPADFCMESPLTRICGSSLLDLLGFNTLSSVEFGTWEQLHDQIGRLLSATGELDLEFVRAMFPSDTSGNGALDFLIDVVPGREAPGGLCNTWSCIPALKNIRRKGEDPDRWDFSECRTNVNIERKFDYGLIQRVIAEDYPSLSRIVHHLDRFPKIAFFLYSAEIDTFGPREGFAQELRELRGRAEYRALEGSHVGFFEDPIVWKDLLSTR